MRRLMHFGGGRGVLQWREFFVDDGGNGWVALKLWDDPDKKLAIYEIMVPKAWEPTPCSM
jgi:hypothetical protein